MVLQRAAVYACLLLLALAAWRLIKKSHLHLPPGPRCFPIIGNLLSVPKKNPWMAYAKWKEQYGDIIYLNILGNPIVVLNSHKACVDLLEKRSTIYSNRPRLVVFNELMGFDWQFVLMPYSTRWRHNRRLFHQVFNENAAPNHRPAQERSVHALLQRLSRDSDNFLEHISLSFAQTILYIVYGIDVKDHDNMYVQLVQKSVVLATEAVTQGRYLVEMFPFLQYVPTWFPGASFHKDIAKGRRFSKDVRDLPASFVERNMNAGAASSAYASMLEMCEKSGIKKDSNKIDADIAKSSAAMAYLAGADTTLSSVQTLFMALANHPEVQAAAQAELDTVIGTKRLPSFDDMQDLPYINAIMKEILRWHTVVPLSLPHCLSQDDVYEGYTFSKGTTFLPNIWAILRDPEIYPDPHTFNPSRWLVNTSSGVKLNDDIPDPDIATFGFGRRICPGRHLARSSLFITVSNVLACFNISPLDSTGKPTDRVPEDFTDALLIYPKPFKVSITARSDRITRLLKEISVL